MLPCAASAFTVESLSVGRSYPQRPVYVAEMHFNAFEPPLRIEVDWGDGATSNNSIDDIPLQRYKITHMYGIVQQTQVTVTVTATDATGKSYTKSKTGIVTP